MLLSIGAFSRLTGLSIKALRLYDAARILRPAEVDGGNGYRRYRLAQIVEAQRILALRQMGMPLVEVRRGPADRASLEALRDTLETQMESLASQLAAVNEALGAMGAGGAPAVVVKRIPSMRVIAKRHRLGHQGEADDLLASLCERHPAALSGSIWCASCVVGADDFDAAYRALSRWRGRRNDSQAGPYRELYYRDQGHGEWLEVQLPIACA